MTSRMLKRHGIESYSAGDGTKAVEHMQQLLDLLSSSQEADSTPMAEGEGEEAKTTSEGPRLVQGPTAGSAMPKRMYDFVLMDQSMPGIPGDEAVRRLRRMGITCKIYGVTGNALDDDRKRFVDAGVDHIFTKPLMIDAFFGRLKLDFPSIA